MTIEQRKAIETLIALCHANSVGKGFWDKKVDVLPDTGEVPKSKITELQGDEVIPEKLMLIVTELSEAMEDYRDGRPVHHLSYDDQSGKPEGFPSELADAVIRIFDLAGRFDVPLVEAIEQKMRYNSGRPHMHGGKRC